jgi:hypothetical protein
MTASSGITRGPFFLPERQEHLREHAGSEPLLRIRNSRPHLNGPGAHIDLGIDHIDRAMECVPRIGVCGQIDGLTRGEVAKQRLRHLEVDLQGVQIFQVHEIPADPDEVTGGDTPDAGHAGEGGPNFGLGQPGRIEGVVGLS